MPAKKNAEFLDIQSADEKNLFANLQIFILVFIFAYGATYLDKAELDQRQFYIECCKKFWFFIGGQYIASQFFYSPLEHSASAFSAKMPRILKKKAYIDLDNYVQSYTTIRSKLHAKDIIYFDNLLRTLSIEIYEQGQNVARSDFYKKRCDHITALCEIYADRKIPDLAPNSLANTTVKIDNLLSTYPDLACTMQHYLMSILSPDSNSMQNRPQSLLLVGPSGVGKTHFINEISRALDFSIAHIDSKEFASTDLRFYNSYLYDVDEFSEIAKAILQHNRCNTPGYLIICMDELDKQIQKNEDGKFDLNKTPSLYKNLLHLTDSNSESYFDTTVNAHLNLSKVIVVILTNADFVVNTPLNRRVKKIKFPALTPEIKHQIATNKIQELCIEKNIQLNVMEHEFLQKMIANDKLPGAGQLLDEIKIFLSALKNASSFDSTSWKISSKELLHSFNHEMYQRKANEWLERITEETNSQNEVKSEQSKLTVSSRRHSF